MSMTLTLQTIHSNLSPPSPPHSFVIHIFTSFTSSTSHYFDAAGKVNTPRSIKAKVSGSRPGSRSLSRHKLRKVSTVVTTVVAEGILRGWGHWGRGDRGGHVLVSPQGRCREKQTGCTTKLGVIKTQPLKNYVQSWLHSTEGLHKITATQKAMWCCHTSGTGKKCNGLG